MGEAILVKGTFQPGTVKPKAPGTSSTGTSNKFAREDHVHPLQSIDLNSLGTCKVVVGTYTGNGNKVTGENESQIIKLGSKPKAVIISGLDGHNIFGNYNGGHTTGICTNNYPLKYGSTKEVTVIEIVSNGFKVYAKTNDTNNSYANDNGATFAYVAFI